MKLSTLVLGMVLSVSAMNCVAYEKQTCDYLYDTAFNISKMRQSGVEKYIVEEMIESKMGTIALEAAYAMPVVPANMVKRVGLKFAEEQKAECLKVYPYK